ncbi:YlbL family protein [Halobacteroides halobius]|uniref:YlbL family protein n=1 Tax=Halobacteroides halobius TaxID=42422 RepID=UPI001FE0F857|nr:PDZ domain-containing protein [Halobacteroides halobius]
MIVGKGSEIEMGIDLIKKRSFWIKALIVVVVVGILAVYPSDYYLISPGIAKPLSPMVNIKADTYLQTGKVMLTAVSMKSASLLEYMYVKLFNPDLIELQSKNLLPPNMNMEEYFKFMREMMKESQMKAKAVALEAAGYNPQVSGQGAKITHVLKEGNAKGKLKPGDIIIKVDGEPVGLLTEVVSEIQDRKVGAQVRVTVKRDGVKKTYSIKTKKIQNNADNPSIGVLITSYKREYDFPIKININAGRIGGPSAGSMFALQIFNQLTKKDYTYGLKIAGTGTISLEGKVGRIDGVKQKIAAAKERGAKIFFTPQANAKAAKEMETPEIKIVSVKNFTDIINYLKSLK